MIAIIYLFIKFKVVYFIVIVLVHVSVLSCEHTCTSTQHYNVFQCFTVTAVQGFMQDTIIASHTCFGGR